MTAWGTRRRWGGGKHAAVKRVLRQAVAEGKYVLLADADGRAFGVMAGGQQPRMVSYTRRGKVVLWAQQHQAA
jgi:hypothetical protein